MKRLLLLASFILGLQVIANAQMADDIDDAVYICNEIMDVSMDISFFQKDATDPDPAACGDAITNSGWLKVKAVAAGNITINFLDISGTDFSIAVYNTDINGDIDLVNPPVACKVTSGGSDNVTFAAVAEEEFYVLVDPEEGKTGFFRVNATGSIEKPDLSLSSSQIPDNGFLSSYEIENNSTANGDLDDFNLIVTFIPADVSCFDTEGWELPTIISINSTPADMVVAGSVIVPNFKIDDVLEIGSDFPGEWELTLEPVNQQCYAQQREKSITNITVFRLLPYRTTDNTFAEQVCGDDVYCDQNPINEWYAKAVILPETSSTPQPQITQWDWEFFTKDGTPIFSRSSTVSDEIDNFDGNDQIGFTLTTAEEALLEGIDYEIKINVEGNNGPGVYESLLEAYSANTPTLSVSNPIVCISDINAANPLIFEVTNAQTLSPKPIAGMINWTIPTELGGGVRSGSNEEILSFLDNSQLEPCTYTLTAEMVDELGCTETNTVDVTIVAQEEIIITSTTPIDPATAREQCGVTVYKAGDKVKFDFNVDKVASCQPVNVTVTYGGTVILAPPTQNVETASYSFEITHNGSSEPIQIVAEKVDETLRVCNTAFSIPLPLFLEGGPELSIAGPVCEKDISTSNPFQILLSNAGDLPSPVKTTWINPPGTVLIQDDVSISLTDLPFGTYNLEAQVEYGAGCSDLVSIDFEILQQADVSMVNIVGPDGDCISPRGFQIGDELTYFYNVSDIPAGTTVTIQTPSGTTAPQAISGPEFNGEFNITVLDESLEADGITWNAGKITVISENGCEKELDIEIPVVPAPLSITPLEDETICINESSVTLSVGVLYSEENPVTFTWTSNDITLPAANTNSSITIDGLQENQSYVITATVENPLCTLTRDFTVNVNTTPPALVYNVLEDPSSMQTNCDNEEGFCNGQAIKIEFGSTTATEDYSVLVNIEGEEGDIYDFAVGDPLKEISYTVTSNPEPITLKIWNTAGSEDCAITETVEVPILQLVEVIGEDEGCNGSVVREIGVTPTCNESGFTFDWSVSDPDQLNIITSNPVNDVRNNKVTIDLTGQPDGTYEFKVEVSNGECSQIVPININFSNSLPDGIEYLDPLHPGGVYCPEDLPANNHSLRLNFPNGGNGNDALRIDWSSTPDESKALIAENADLTDESIPVNIPAGTAPGTYEFIAEVKERSSENECTTTLTYSLKIIDGDEFIVITPESPEVCTFIETQLSASGGNSYTWSKVDASGNETVIGTGPTLVNLFHEEPGTHTYKAEDLENQCIEAGVFELVVTDCDLFVPNVFTPDNGDDINQTFEIPRISGRSWTLTIFNRYGDQVYKNSNYDNSWAGENLSDGMYYYHLKSKEGTKEFKGWLRLLKARTNGDSR